MSVCSPLVGGGVTPSQVWVGGAHYAALSNGGVPHPVMVGVPLYHPGWGVPPPPSTWPGGYPGYPLSRPGMRYPPNPDLGQGTSPPPQTWDGVLATRRAVCLLRSRRRTFLLVSSFDMRVR